MRPPQRKRAISVVKLGGAFTPAPIEMYVTADEVGITMSLDDFLAALTAKVGNPSLMFTQTQLQARLAAAAAEIVTAMKAETTKLV